VTNLERLNAADNDKAIKLLEPLIERAPHIAQQLVQKRPFKDAKDISTAIAAELMRINDESRIALFNAHPELAPDKPLEMTEESQSEQARLHLTTDFNAEIEELKKLNLEYKAKFGFPFITALVRHENLASVLDEFRARLSGARKAEMDEAIGQVMIVSNARVLKSFGASANSGASHET